MANLPFFVSGVRGGDLKSRIDSIMFGAVQRPVRMVSRLALASAAITVVVGPLAVGAFQQPGGITEAAFEAASIRRNVSGADGWALNPRPTGQFDAINARLSDLVIAGHLLQDDQVENMPPWARNVRYDIVARLDPAIAGASQPPGLPPTWSLALRQLLRDRMQLDFHREIAQRPVYALMLARTDGKLGPGMRRAKFDCDALKEQALAAARVGGPSPYPPTTATEIACGVRPSRGRILQGGNGLAEFRAILSRIVGRPILDRTGLTGNWDFLLTYTPQDLLRAGELPPADSPDLFTALREQLGLKLESTTGPVEMFVIDRLEPPSEN